MTTPGFGGMGLLDSFMFGGGFEILFFLIFALVLCLFIVMIVRGVSQWHRNNNSPRLTVEATVVAKRIDVSHHHHRSGETPARGGVEFVGGNWKISITGGV